MMDESTVYSCTDLFEERDFLFLASVVADEADDSAFRRFISDRSELLGILDDERVFRTLLEAPGLLNVSPQLYFYVLVRHSLKRTGLEEFHLAEYLGAVLARRVPIGPHHALKGIPGGFVHTVDFMAVLDRTSGDTRYELLVSAGNQFLVLTGIFPDYIRYRSERHGGPGIEHYENFARSTFHEAQCHPRAVRDGLRGVLCTLTEVLPDARRSLNRMADSLLFLAS